VGESPVIKVQSKTFIELSLRPRHQEYTIDKPVLCIFFSWFIISSDASHFQQGHEDIHLPHLLPALLGGS